MIQYAECDNCGKCKGNVGDRFYLVSELSVNERRKEERSRTLIFCSPRCVASYMVGKVVKNGK